MPIPVVGRYKNIRSVQADQFFTFIFKLLAGRRRNYRRRNQQIARFIFPYKFDGRQNIMDIVWNTIAHNYGRLPGNVAKVAGVLGYFFPINRFPSLQFQCFPRHNFLYRCLGNAVAADDVAIQQLHALRGQRPHRQGVVTRDAEHAYKQRIISGSQKTGHYRGKSCPASRHAEHDGAARNFRFQYSGKLQAGGTPAQKLVFVHRAILDQAGQSTLTPVKILRKSSPEPPSLTCVKNPIPASSTINPGKTEWRLRPVRAVKLMEKEQLVEEFRDFFALSADLRRERGELKLKIHLARCGIQKEWEKSESMWQRLKAANDCSPDISLQLALELKDIYARIYRGLLMKNTNLLARLNGIEREKAGNLTQLEILERQVTDEITAIQSKLKILGAEAETIAEEKPVCTCLKCRQETGKQPFDLDQVPGI